MNNPIPRLLLAAVLLLPLLAPAQEYRVSQTLPTRGTVQVLQADSASRRLYAGRENALDIYDMDSGQIIASLDLPGTVAGIALAPQHGQAYVSLSDSGQIVTVDLNTQAVIRSLRSSGKQPGELVHDPVHGRVYVSHAGDGVLLALDANTGRRTGVLNLGGRLRGLSLDGRGKLFVADEARDVLHVVDITAEKLRTLGEIPVWPGRAPTALANDTRERRLYVATGNSKMIVVDPDPGQMLSVINTRGTGAAGIAIEYAPERLVRLYLPNADGHLDVVKNAKLTPSLQTTLTQSGITTAIAFDATSKRAFVASANGIRVIEQ